MSGTTAAGHSSVPNVMVVDPRFDAYLPLAAAAREGRLNLHLRSGGSEAMRLARRLPIDVWIVGQELDDMSGQDFVELLGSLDCDRPAACVALVGPGSDEPRRSSAADGTWALGAGADAVLRHPISLDDLAGLLALPADERPMALPLEDWKRRFVTLPVGVGAAAIAVAVLMLG